jgi:hypothetical protein
MNHYKTILPFLLLLFCFSCKNSNLDNDNSLNTPIPEENTEQVIDAEGIPNDETNQQVTEENSTTKEYNETGERCNICNEVLETPTNRACYICNRTFSGWGFIKNDYGVTKEHGDMIVECYPDIGIHNYNDWTIREDACCSRKCAMSL